MKRYSLSDLKEPFAADFKREVEAGNFLRGGQPLLVIGHGAELEVRKWHSCLGLANIPSFLTNPIGILRRLDGKYIPRNDEQLIASFEEAETIIIQDMFSPETILSKNRLSDFVWFVKEAIRDGVVIVIATDNQDPDLNTHGDYLGSLIEKEFEVIQHGKKTTSRKVSK